MNKLFPVLRHFNIPNGITSIAVVLALYCQVLAVKGDIKGALTLFVLVLVFNRMDGVLARRLGQVSEFGREIGSLSELLNFVVTPIIIAYYMGFSDVYAIIFFMLFLLAAIWRLADFNLTGMIQKNNKICFQGLCCTHSSALFVIVASLYTRFLSPSISFVFIPYFIVVSLLMISSFLYNKNGKLTLSFYILTPISVIIMWL